MVERAIVLDPQPCAWSAGSPSPVVLSSEVHTFVIFNQAESGPHPGEVLAVEFLGCLLVTTGFPNDEALHGHRLWGRGLQFYRVHEVMESAWLAEQQAIENHHERSLRVPIAEMHHYVLTFHDSTIEALAQGLVLAGTWDATQRALSDLTPQLAG